MYARFKINVSEIQKLETNIKKIGRDMTPIKFEAGKTKAYKDLDYFTTGVNDREQVIDGSALQQYVFPTGKDGKYHVFISHSHDDLEDALLLATFLKRYCHLNVFLDSYVWKSADGLLQKIDDKYCKQKDGKYNYHRRNFSTAHVHAMLSMAILDIINKTECCIFIESNHSIKLSTLEKASSAKTLSPWIYEEYAMMKTLPRHRSGSDLKSFCKAEGITESREFKMMYNADFYEFMELKYTDFLSLGNGEQVLEDWYVRFDSFEDQLLIKKYGIQD